MYIQFANGKSKIVQCEMMVEIGNDSDTPELARNDASFVVALFV